MHVAVPAPLPSKQAIADVISTTKRQASMRSIAEAERAIDLLQERRTALISAAVTGQIDVRGLVAHEAEAA